jgi:hypothetical protein
MFSSHLKLNIFMTEFEANCALPQFFATPVTGTEFTIIKTFNITVIIICIDHYAYWFRRVSRV